MIITMIMDQYGDGNNGTTMTAMRFAEILKSHGHTIRIITASQINEPNFYVTKERNVPILKQVGRSQGMIFAKPDKKLLKEAIMGSDIVHFLMPFKIQRVAKKICDELGIATTAAFHVQPENITYTMHMGKVKWLNKYIYKKFKNSFFNSFNHIHCPSEMIKNQLIENGYKANLHVISNGVLPDFMPIDVSKPCEISDKFIILMIGRYSREKRQDLIINAIKNSKYEKNIQLILCGSGPWKKHLEKMGSTLTNKPIMKFCNKEELIKTINYSDLYIHASDAEIEAIACIEAFTCGLVPIISDSKMSATNQFALNDRNLFACGSYISLKDKIEFYYENPDIKDSDSSKYIDYAKQYQIDNCVKQLENVFSLAIKENK